jgi:hypothetical protein
MNLCFIPERDFAFFADFRAPKEHSAARLVEDFETKAGMTDERWDRIALLENSPLI